MGEAETERAEREKRKKMSEQAHADFRRHPLTSALARGDQALRVRVQADAAEDDLLRWLLLLLLLREGNRVGEAPCGGDLGLARQRRRR